MTRVLKLIGITAITLILLALVAIFLLITFVSPNSLKPIITAQATKQTGREVIIDGDLSWTFFPNLGVRVGHATMSNPPGFADQNFAEIKQATVKVKLMPLFHGQIQSDGIALNGMHINLHKKANGETNWKFDSKTSNNNHEPSPSPSVAQAPWALAIANISINNANVSIVDEQQNKIYQINNFNFQVKNLALNQSVPLVTNFDITSTNPELNAHVNATADARMNNETQQYALNDIKITSEIKQNQQEININVTGNLRADLKQNIAQLSDLTAQIANMNLTGNIQVDNLSTNPQTQGRFQIGSFDLKSFLNKIGQPAPSLQSADHVQGNVNLSGDQNGFTAQGNFGIESIQAAKIKMRNMKIVGDWKNHILNLSSVTADLYEGSLQNKAQINLNTPQPHISMQTKLTKVQIKPLLEDLGGANHKLKLSGLGNINLQITTIGKETNALLRNLNGNSQFSFNDGALEGVDLGYLVDSAYAMIKGRTPPDRNEGKTNFGNLTGTAVIHSGVINNKDLLLQSPRFTYNGQGEINLVTQRINYTVNITVKKREAAQKDSAEDFYGIPVPVLLSGNLSDPSIRLDSGAIARAATNQQIQKATGKLQEQFKDKVKINIPPEAGQLLQNLLGH